MKTLSGHNFVFKYTLYCIALIFIIEGCNTPAYDVEPALQSAGRNRHELEKVLEHFKHDRFKYDAACFLISNMIGKHSYTGWQIDSLKAIKLLGRMNDDLMAEWKGFNYKADCKKIYDIDIIDARLLIDNIDLACETWLSRPWHKHYSFDEFCEYVLPYRIEDEPLENWRNAYYKRYAPLIDSIVTKKCDVIEIAALIASKLKSEGFDNHADVEVPHLGALYLLEHRVGYCRENCDIALYAMRALGIPVATDFYISSPSYNSRHFWSAVIDTNHCAVPFNYTEESISRVKTKNDRKKGKVYRTMFGLQPQKYPDMKSANLPAVFIHPFTKDVSNEYFADNQPVEQKFNQGIYWGYLSIYNGEEYEAIDIAPVKYGKAIFNNIEDNIILFPTIYVDGKQIPSDYPILTGKSSHHIFIPDKNIQVTATIQRKYPIRNTAKFISNMIGGSIEVSGDVDFINSSKVIEFNDTIKTNFVKLTSDLKGVRFIRYNGPVDKKIEVAEMHFFSKNRELLPVSITSNHILDDIHIRNLNLITDNIWSSFYMSGKGESLTFDLGAAYNIDKIIFVPRNDDNFVREGQDYELFFHDGDNGWRSLGRKHADADSLIYDNIPANSVLWLHNHSGGKEERCFYIADNKQVFI